MLFILQILLGLFIRGGVYGYGWSYEKKPTSHLNTAWMVAPSKSWTEQCVAAQSLASSNTAWCIPEMKCHGNTLIWMCNRIRCVCVCRTYALKMSLANVSLVRNGDYRFWVRQTSSAFNFRCTLLGFFKKNMNVSCTILIRYTVPFICLLIASTPCETNLDEAIYWIISGSF